MTPEDLRAELDRLDLPQNGLAALLEVDARTVRRWCNGDWPVPRSVALLLPRLTPEEVVELMPKVNPSKGARSGS